MSFSKKVINIRFFALYPACYLAFRRFFSLFARSSLSPFYIGFSAVFGGGKQPESSPRKSEKKTKNETENDKTPPRKQAQTPKNHHRKEAKHARNRQGYKLLKIKLKCLQKQAKRGAKNKTAAGCR